MALGPCQRRGFDNKTRSLAWPNSDAANVDIEGAEDQVLKDLNETGKLALVREIVLEYHHHLTPREDKLGVFLKILEQTNFGYQLKAAVVPPFRKGEFQALMLYAYQLNGA